MSLNNGDVVKIDFTAKIKDKNEVFDTTNEQKAVEAGIFDKHAKYKPLTLIVGSGEVIQALDDALKEMKLGEEKKITVEANRAYGDRKAELVKVVPLQEFRNRNVQPVPGLVVNLNDAHGKVQSVSGGRVRVDFNHPLAGQTLEYDVRLVQQVTEEKTKIQTIVQKYLPFVEAEHIKIATDSVSVVVSGTHYNRAAQVKPIIAGTLLKYLDKVQVVKFTDEFTKDQVKEEKAEK